MPEWDADVMVDETLVRALLDEQFPELEGSTARLLAEGWDNAVWLVEEQWAFRFPRREIAVPLLAREIAIAPRLAPLVPVPIPTPTFLGQPGPLYPWPFVGGSFIPGREAGDAGLHEDERDVLAAQLGAFLRVLHSPEVAETADPDRILATDPLRRADMSLRVQRTRDRLAKLERRGLWSAPDAVETILASAELLPPAEASSLVHGDLHFRHLLVDGGELTGVIDWGDMCRADPSVDLLLSWSYFGPSERSALVDAYGPISDERLLRARVLAIFICAILAEYGTHEGLASITNESLAGLERALVD